MKRLMLLILPVVILVTGCRHSLHNDVPAAVVTIYTDFTDYTDFTGHTSYTDFTDFTKFTYTESSASESIEKITTEEPPPVSAESAAESKTELPPESAEEPPVSTEPPPVTTKPLAISAEPPPVTTEKPPISPVQSDETVPNGIFREELALEIFDLVNIERVNAGVPELIWDEDFAAVAMNRAAELPARFGADHKRPDGREWYTIIKDAGIKYYAVGENIARGGSSYTTHRVMYGWMNSKGHMENILSEAFEVMGVGAFDSDGRRYYVQHFGTYQ